MKHFAKQGIWFCITLILIKTCTRALRHIFLSAMIFILPEYHHFFSALQVLA